MGKVNDPIDQDKQISKFKRIGSETSLNNPKNNPGLNASRKLPEDVKNRFIHMVTKQNYKMKDVKISWFRRLEQLG